MLKFGIISEVDASKGLARVTFADEPGPDGESLVSSWLPVSSPRTLKDKFSIPFDVNEQVWCLMDENVEFGVIGGAIFSSADVPTGAVAGNIYIHLDNGLFIDYSRQQRILTVGGTGDVKINIPAGNADVICTKATVTAATEIDLTAPVVKMSGALVVAGVVTAAGVTAAAGAGGDGNITIAGSVTVQGDVTAGGISLKTHKHSGVQTGGGISGFPV